MQAAGLVGAFRSLGTNGAEVSFLNQPDLDASCLRAFHRTENEFLQQALHDCSWAISRSKCVAKFGSNRLSLFDSTTEDTYQKPTVSQLDADDFSYVQIFNPPQLRLKPNPALAMSELGIRESLARALPKGF
jgi:hypothetical protein